MLDQRGAKVIDLSSAKVLKPGAAYKYIDISTNKELVVKIIADYSDENDAILIAEFRKLALLSSEPEIATVYFLAKATVNNEEKSCYVMEYIDGYDLSEFVSPGQYIDYSVAIDIIIQIASALEKSHHYDIFHNDLHSKNVIINTLGYVKVIDFLWWDSREKKLIN